MQHQLLICCLALLAFSSASAAQDRSYGRSMVITQNGIAATSQTLASQAAAQILARGGSSVDAAIAANAVLGVTEPMMCGIGGDMFAIYWDAKSGKLYGINGSGWAPRGLTPAFLRSRGISQMPHLGIHTVTVPGCVDGWSKMHARFGRLPWRELFDPAITYAEKGYPVAEVIQAVWSEDASVKELSSDDESRRVFLPHGRAPEVGEIFRNADMAKALRLVAEGGRDAFYKGPIAQAILRTSAAHQGTMSADDLANFSAEWVEPISTEYRGWRVYELPPNGQGMAALEMLNIMETVAPSPEGPQSADQLHFMIEAMKLAYSDLARYLADPRFAHVPVRGLLSKDYARSRAREINPERANCNVAAGVPSGSDTTYFAVVDREGNIASWIQSLSAGWGSGIVAQGMGFMLQNRGALFTLDPNHPNVLAPHKRPFHTIIPAFMEKGDLHIGFGIMGGLNQPQAHAQFVSKVVDYGMNLQSAMSAPRFTRLSVQPGCDVKIESRLGPQVIRELERRGHKLEVRQEYSLAMGRGQAVMHQSSTGVNFGASDPRADGSAEPEPLPAPPQR